MAKLGYYVSEQLHKRNLLSKFIVFSKGKFDTEFPTLPVSGKSRYILFILNRLNRIIKLPDHKFRLLQEHIYDILCRRHINKNIGVLFTTNAHLKRTFSRAKKLGIPIIYAPANPEENYICELITEEHKKLNITKEEPYTYKPRLSFYNRSIPYVDTVIGTYPTVYKTYKTHSKVNDVQHINGFLKIDFKPYDYSPSPVTSKLKVIYLATTVPLKGLQYLLAAWEKLMQHQDIANNFELHVVGRIEKSVQYYVNKNYPDLKQVQYKGRVKDVTSELQEMDLCVIPSLTDGGPYVAFEAAHYGLPIIITENCGSTELLSNEPKGCLPIPIQDADAIYEKILWVYNNREMAKQIGINGKQHLDNYDMDTFIKQVADYLEDALSKQNVTV